MVSGCTLGYGCCLSLWDWQQRGEHLLDCRTSWWHSKYRIHVGSFRMQSGECPAGTWFGSLSSSNSLPSASSKSSFLIPSPFPSSASSSSFPSPKATGSWGSSSGIMNVETHRITAVCALSFNSGLLFISFFISFLCNLIILRHALLCNPKSFSVCRAASENVILALLGNAF